MLSEMLLSCADPWLPVRTAILEVVKTQEEVGLCRPATYSPHTQPLFLHTLFFFFSPAPDVATMMLTLSLAIETIENVIRDENLPWARIILSSFNLFDELGYREKNSNTMTKWTFVKNPNPKQPSQLGEHY